MSESSRTLQPSEATPAGNGKHRDLPERVAKIETRLEQMVTREDLQKAVHDLSEKINAVARESDGKLNAATRELNEKINETSKELNEKIDGVSRELTGKIDEVSRELNVALRDVEERTNIKWYRYLATIIGTATAVSALAGVLL